MAVASTSDTQSSAGSELRQHVSRVNRRARGLLWWRGVGWSLMTTCLATTIAVTLDWWLRLEDTGLRALLSAGTGAAVATACWRWLRPALRSLSELEVARRIEGRFPQLRDRLTSALEFQAGARCRNSGAPPLQDAAIRHAWADASQLDLEQCLDVRPTRRALLVCGVTLAMVGAVAWAHAPIANRGLRRLAAPWAGPPWPRENRLEYIEPPKHVLRGESVKIRAADQNRRLAESGTLELWFDGDPISDVERQVMELRGQELSAVIVDVGRSLQYRVLAGDDDLPWRRLQLMEPAKLEAWSLLAKAPDYVGGTTTEIGDRASLLIGSELMLSGRLSRPLGPPAAEAPTVPGPLVMELVGSDERRWPLRLRDNQYSFELPEPLRLEQPGVFQFWVECYEGATPDLKSRLGPQVEIQVAADTAPTIAWTAPQDGRLAAPNSRVPLDVSVKDNTEVRLVECLAEVGEGAQRRLTLHQSSGSRNAHIERDLRLADWGVRPGDVVRLMVRAEDSRPMANGNEGSLPDQSWEDRKDGRAATPWRQIRVVTVDELAAQHASRQAAIFQRLEQLLEMQRTTRSRTQDLLRDLRTDLEARRELEAERRETLQGVELEQRRVLQVLGSPRGSTGVAGLVRELIAEFDLTPDFADQRKRLLELQTTLESVVAPYADDVQRSLVAALQFAKVGEPAADSTSNVDTAVAAQTGVVQALEGLLADAQQWTNFQQAARSLSLLIERQQQLGARMEESHFLQLTIPQDDALPAMAEEQASQQQTLARDLDKLLANLERLRSQDEHPLATREQQAIGRALKRAQSTGIASLTRDVAIRLQRQQWGPALEGNQRLLLRLREVFDELQLGGEPGSEDEAALAARLDRWVEEASRLAEAWKQTPESEDDRPGRLQRARNLSAAAAAVSDQLQSDAPVAAESAGVAAMMMSQAGVEGASPSQRSKNAAAAGRQMAAAAREWRSVNDAGAGASPLQTWQATVAAIADRQQLLLDFLESTDDMELSDYSLLQEKQQALRDELMSAAAWSDSQILNASLLRAAPTMEAASVELGLGNGDAAAAAMRAAMRCLLELQSSLSPATDNAAAAAGDQDAEAASGAQQRKPGTLKLAELKMLLAMQRAIAQRTIDLDQLKQRRPLRPGELDEQRELAQRQGQLAAWLQALVQPQEADMPASEQPQPATKSSGKPSAIDSLIDRFQGAKP